MESGYSCQVLFSVGRKSDGDVIKFVTRRSHHRVTESTEINGNNQS